MDALHREALRDRLQHGGPARGREQELAAGSPGRDERGLAEALRVHGGPGRPEPGCGLGGDRDARPAVCRPGVQRAARGRAGEAGSPPRGHHPHPREEARAAAVHGLPGRGVRHAGPGEPVDEAEPGGGEEGVVEHGVLHARDRRRHQAAGGLPECTPRRCWRARHAGRPLRRALCAGARRHVDRHQQGEEDERLLRGDDQRPEQGAAGPGEDGDGEEAVHGGPEGERRQPRRAPVALRGLAHEEPALRVPRPAHDPTADLARLRSLG
mmetsp:Transcript_979/g.2763  ORF Transcript_979/g.2763 Transcript_979/m.2763 type:complete len:268 (+) Transcript_979:503-1306(+)